MTKRKMQVGVLAGEFVMADDFDSDSDELADAFGIPRT